MAQRTLLPPDHPRAPRYWMHETGGQLQPAVMRYLEGQPAQPDDLSLLRAYLRQWIDSPVWEWPDTQTELAKLRKGVRELRDREGITVWLWSALDLGIDPL